MSKTRKVEPDPDRIRKGVNPHSKRAIVRMVALVGALAAAGSSHALAGARPVQRDSSSGGAKTTVAAAGVVNVNTASVLELSYLPGVGAKVAAAIVAGRPYSSAAELDKVKGIGKVTLAKMRPYVVVAGATTAAGKLGKVAKVNGIVFREPKGGAR